MKHQYFNFRDQHLWLSPERTIFWEDEKALILSDSHFGRTGHFRKSGIGVPQSVYKEDLHKLFALIQHYKPEQLIIAIAVNINAHLLSQAPIRIFDFTKYPQEYRSFKPL